MCEKFYSYNYNIMPNNKGWIDKIETSIIKIQKLDSSVI